MYDFEQNNLDYKSQHTKRLSLLFKKYHLMAVSVFKYKTNIKFWASSNAIVEFTEFQ